METMTTDNEGEVLDSARAVALREFALRSAVPLLALGDTSQGSVVGTGHLFGVGGLVFLVTARHVIEDVQQANLNPADLGIPVYAGRPRYITLRDIRVARWEQGSGQSLDVTSLRLDCAEVVEQLGAEYEVLGLDNLSPDLERYRRYHIAGFPSESYRIDGREVTPVPVAISESLRRTDGFPVDPADPVFRLAYPNRALDEQGRLIPAPNMKGMSGAGVWGVDLFPESGELWTPRSSLRLAGVQYAVASGQYVACVRWAAVAAQIGQLHPPVRELLRKHLRG